MRTSSLQLLAEPMITREPGVSDAQEVAVMLHDFALDSPAEILRELGGSSAHGGYGGLPGMAGHGGVSEMGPMRGMGGIMGHSMGPLHANDIR